MSPSIEQIRPFALSDRDACLGVFDSNTPAYFDTAERAAFGDYLECSAPGYYVLEREARIVACGGYALQADGNNASLCWGMVAHGLHGQGLGRLLTEARLAVLRGLPQIAAVHISTSQHSQGFYTGLGFVVVKIIADGHGPGLDCWDMRLALR
nr:GNAT family N-acetyltransferase [Pseudomonas sp. FFPRI_1]